ncbi:hypothetical protein MettiDRAFT_1931 [Methanolobus tindarius DSM 2278]|uniref:Uncharacterized protein n=1 Tax=Methanolobus tindarius DSM 2278 TaxID=1090322 RepID=W9DS59_METTI|nr:hypothetical protein [Methanolobus tindarius]ETA68460.1 hypothetical protein MettiDRAFT_1931 [Methanolobus tindarius DSM 2278]
MENNSNNYEGEHPEIIKQKGLESLILLIIGADKSPISLLHLQKETFLLWNFHPYMKEFIHFVGHYRGPFSSEVEKTVLYPRYLEDCWSYIPPRAKPSRDILSGGYVQITQKGQNKYDEIYSRAVKLDNLRVLLSGIKAVRELYDKLNEEELLLLIYDTYPEYKLKSNVSNMIFDKKNMLAKQIYEKGFIDKERMENLIG